MIRVVTRCRVDLGGGTLDIWPIGLLHEGSVTVNVAIELAVTVTMSRRERGFVVRQAGSQLCAETPDELLHHPETVLAARVIDELALPPVELAIESRSPRGGGLGASSALAVALLAAGELLTSGELARTPEERARIARDLEARMMSLPTGAQDHLPAQLGGALAIEHRAGGDRIRKLDVDLDALGERMVVAYTGESHFSAGQNWQVIRRRLDGEAEVIAQLDRVRDAAAALPEALEAGEWERAGRLVGNEWEGRRRFAEGIDTPRIASLLGLASEHGAWGGKACGAGGGGSIVVLAPPESRQRIVEAWKGRGAFVLEAAPTARGLEFET